MNSNHIKEYEKLIPKYEDFSKKIVNLLNMLIKNEEIRFASIESRVKSSESFRKKISRPEKKYANPLNDITDLIGIRIITYLITDVKKIGNLLGEEFLLDIKNCVIKSNELKTNEFGYLSDHYIVSLSEKRKLLPEWKDFRKIKIEIQIRTLLQHSWAEIQHSLEYKAEETLPKVIRRKLYRLASILELADDEFANITESQNEIIKSASQNIKKGDSNIEINLNTLKVFLENDSLCSELKKEASLAGFEVSETSSEDSLTTLFYLCQKFRFGQIKDLADTIKISKKQAVYYYKELYKIHKVNSPNEAWKISPSFTITLLLIYLNYQTFNIHNLQNIGFHRSVANRILELTHRIRENKKIATDKQTAHNSD